MKGVGNPDDYIPDWPLSECPHFQMYETSTEGTPISPVMADKDSLAGWLADEMYFFDFNQRDQDGRTLLHHADICGDMKVVDDLTHFWPSWVDGFKVDIEAVDTAGKSPMDYAREHGNREVVQILKASMDSGKPDLGKLGASLLSVPSVG